MRELQIRELTLADLPTLSQINATFTSNTTLRVERKERGVNLTWKLQETRLEKPFDRGNGYDLGAQDLSDIRRWLEKGQGLHLLVLDGYRPVALLNVEPQNWNRTAFIWNILVDKEYRQQGLGKALIERAIAWARENKFRALCLETQTNNMPAIGFYRHLGFRLTGIREDFYSNRDIERGEVAIFFSYRLDQ